MSIKLLIITDLFPPALGGPATYTFELAKSLVKNEFHVTVLTLGKPAHEKIDEYEIHRVSPTNFTMKNYLSMTVKGVKLAGAHDLIFSHLSTSAGIPAAIIKKLTGKPLLMRFVGDFAWEFSYMKGLTKLNMNEFWKFPKGFLETFLVMISNFVINNADAIIVPSRFLKKIVEPRVSCPIQIVHNAVDVNLFSPSSSKREEKRQALELGLNERVVLAVGRLVPWKGFDILLKIFPELLREINDAKLIIVGAGPDFNYLMNLAFTLNIQDNVIFTGAVSRTDVISYMRSADLFVLYSGYEGLSHVLLEAMACGLPVIASDIEANREVIVNGENGFLIPLNEPTLLKSKIVECFQNESLLKNVGQNARRLIMKRFSWDSHVNQVKALIKQFGAHANHLTFVEKS